jgi:tRNA(Ile)-lysidine synthase TilS/MesJ
MNDIRTPRGRRERTMHLSPDAERLVTGGLGLANSGSRTEDRFWQNQIEERLEKLLESNHSQVIDQALERLQQTDLEAYGALVEAVEEVAECVRIEHKGEAWEVLLVAAPFIAWTRFGIASGELDSVLSEKLASLWKTHLLADGALISCLGISHSFEN